MQKMSWKEPLSLWNGVLTIRRSKCRKWAHRNVGPLELWFSRLATSQFHSAKLQKRGSKEPRSHWTLSFTTGHTCREWAQRNVVPHGMLVIRLGTSRIFRTPKSRKWAHTNRCPLEVWGSTIRPKSLLPAAKIQKWAHRNLRVDPLVLWILRLDGSRVFRPSKCRTWAHRNVGPLDVWASRLVKSRILGRQKVGNNLTGN